MSWNSHIVINVVNMVTISKFQMTTIITLQSIKLKSLGLDLQLGDDGNDEFIAKYITLAFLGSDDNI